MSSRTTTQCIHRRLIVEVLSPKVNRQRIVALSAALANSEFSFLAGAAVPVRLFGNATIPVDSFFNV